MTGRHILIHTFKANYNINLSGWLSSQMNKHQSAYSGVKPQQNTLVALVLIGQKERSKDNDLNSQYVYAHN